jgi:hypothetical protein
MKTGRRAWAAVWMLAGALAARAQDPPPHKPDTRPFPGLTIEAKAVEDRTADGETIRKVVASGDAEYEPGTILVLELRLKEDSSYIESKQQVIVDSGGWTKESEWLGRNVYKGVYVARIGFDPAHQNRGWKGLRPDLNKGIQYKEAEVAIGTPEEMAAEMAGVEQFYVRALAKAKELLAAVEEQYAAQRKAQNARDWNAFVERSSSDWIDADRRIAEFGRLRMNILDVKTYNRISQVHAVATTFMFSELTAAIGIPKPATKNEIDSAEATLRQIRDSLSAVEERLANVVLDPAWRMPEKPKPARIRQPAPPVVPIIDNPSANVPVGPRPGRDPVGAAPAFGVTELAIAFAVLCGVAILAILLRKKA